METTRESRIEIGGETTVESNVPESATGSGSNAELPPHPNPKKRKATTSGSRLKSEVWQHYEIYETNDPSQPNRCKCKYCGKDYACNTKSIGTSTLKKHLDTQCKKKPNMMDDKKQKVLCLQKNSRGGGSLSSVGFSAEQCRKALIEMIVIDELSFSICEKEGFRRFCQVACPLFTPPSRRSVVRDMLGLYLFEKRKLKEEISKYRVCLTTDTWTSIQNINYMVLTAHFIDSNWVLQKRILNFCVITDHKGESIGKLIEQCLIEWGIEKVLTITVDNASANDVAINYVRRKLNTWREGNILEGVYLHMRCCAHILNLIVTAGLKELHSSIASIRNAVRYVRSSPARLGKFKACIEIVKISYDGLVVLDVPTRWNSTYKMLESALIFEKAFDRLDEEDGHFRRYFTDGEGRDGPPCMIDWENARVFVGFLKTFFDLTKKISSTSRPVIHSFFHDLFAIHSDLSDLISGQEPLLTQMARDMKAKYDKYWGSIENVNQLVMISLVLDPRYKLENVKMHLGELYPSEDEIEIEARTKRLKDVLIRLYELYGAPKLPQNASESATSGGISQSVHAQSSLSIGSDKQRKMREKWKKLQEEKDTVILYNEVDRYLSDACEADVDDFDIMNWWKVNGASKYQVLGAIVRDVLAIPVSTVASESSFSTGGRVIDPFRSSLTPKTVEAVICLQNWLRSTSVSLENEPSIEETEFYEAIESEIATSCVTLEPMAMSID